MEHLRWAGRTMAGPGDHGDVLAGPRKLDANVVPMNGFKQRKFDDLPFDRCITEQDRQVPDRLYSSEKK